MYINSVEYLKTCLRRIGYSIVDEHKQYGDVRPYLIAFHRESEAIVYVDFRIYESTPVRVQRPWYRNWLHRLNVKRVFNKWLRANRWRGKRRFDVVMVFPAGDCAGVPIIDHIVDVKM